MVTAPKVRFLTEPAEPLARRAAELARDGFAPRFGMLADSFPIDPVWKALRDLGTELWLDTGDLDEAQALWTREFSNLTTNNTLVNKEVQKGFLDALIPDSARRLREVEPDLDPGRLVYEVGFILNCRTALRLVEALDARVSVELHPAFADDAATSVAYGRRYYNVCPERFIIQVPLTPAGFLAARQLSRSGIPVNYTLGFSARQNYLAARFSRPRYVNVFMGRLNAFVADNELGDGRNVGEKATLATQRAILSLRQGDPDRDAPRLIGASMRNAGQLLDLAGLDVFTMPTGVAREFHRERRASPGPLASQVAQDPGVDLAPGVDPAAIGLPHLWEIPGAVRSFADHLDRTDVADWDGDHLAAAAREHGLVDLFPEWTALDLQAAEADGKIPRHERWASRLRAGEIGLDALHSVSALYSFVTDQRALDERIRSVLQQESLI